MKALRRITGALVVAAASTLAAAQYPAKPIHIVVPFAAGGPSDMVARTLGRALSESLGQPVIVDNKPGAEGLIAAQAVFNAPADGYTLFLVGSAASAGLGVLKKDVGFNPMELTPISNVANFSFALYVNRDVPAKDVGELVRYAKANPDTLNYAIASNSEFMAAALLMKATGTRMVKVAYKGSAQAIPELLAGRVHVYFAPITAERIAYTKDGRLRMLGTVTPQRVSFTPDVPTMAEAGLPTIVAPGWNALVGPPRMPADVVRKLSTEVAKVLRDQDVRAQFERLLLEPASSTPEELRAMMRSDHQLWTEFVREHDVARE